MPELPEVEVVRRGLESKLVSREISEYKVIEQKSFRNPIDLEIIGTKVSRVDRRAKLLVFELKANEKVIYMLCHLRMTGQLVYDDPDHERTAGGHPSASIRAKLPDNSTRVIFEFDNDGVLYFNDQRKFGFIELVTKQGYLKYPFINSLGPEALALPSVQQIAQRIRPESTRLVKAVLLDQKVMVLVRPFCKINTLVY